MKFPLADHAAAPPPRLSMEEYAEFVYESLRHANPDKIDRLKRIEKQIEVPFKLLPADDGQTA